MQQVDFFHKNLERNMIISVVKIKLNEAEFAFKRAEKKLNDAIKNGSGQDIYDCAYALAARQDRLGNLKILWEQVNKEI